MLRRAKSDSGWLGELRSKILSLVAEYCPREEPSLFRKYHSAGAWPYRNGRRRSVGRWWLAPRGVRRTFQVENDLAALHQSREGNTDPWPAQCSVRPGWCSFEKRATDFSRNPLLNPARRIPGVRPPKDCPERCGFRRNRETAPFCEHVIFRGRDRARSRCRCAGLERTASRSTENRLRPRVSSLAARGRNRRAAWDRGDWLGAKSGCVAKPPSARWRRIRAGQRNPILRPALLRDLSFGQAAWKADRAMPRH